MSEHYSRLQLDIDTNEPESTPYVKRLVTALVSSSDESSTTLALHIEASTFPNWNGKDQKRSFTLAGDKLTLSGIGTSGLPFQDELQRLK